MVSLSILLASQHGSPIASHLQLYVAFTWTAGIQTLEKEEGKHTLFLHIHALPKCSSEKEERDNAAERGRGKGGLIQEKARVQ